MEILGVRTEKEALLKSAKGLGLLFSAPGPLKVLLPLAGIQFPHFTAQLLPCHMSTEGYLLDNLLPKLKQVSFAALFRRLRSFPSGSFQNLVTYAFVNLLSVSPTVPCAP